MKVYVVKEYSIDNDTCDVRVYADVDKAREWAREYISELAREFSEYDSEITDYEDDYYVMDSFQERIIIKIEEQEVL